MWYNHMTSSKYLYWEYTNIYQLISNVDSNITDSIAPLRELFHYIIIYPLFPSTVIHFESRINTLPIITLSLIPIADSPLCTYSLHP